MPVAGRAGGPGRRIIPRRRRARLEKNGGATPGPGRAVRAIPGRRPAAAAAGRPAGDSGNDGGLGAAGEVLEAGDAGGELPQRAGDGERVRVEGGAAGRRGVLLQVEPDRGAHDTFSLYI